MKGIIRAALVASFAAAAVLPSDAEAQYIFRVQRNDAPREEADSLAQRAMHHDIAHIEVAQGAHFARTGRFAARLSDLEHLHLESAADFVLAEVTETGWQLTATHPRLTGAYRLTLSRSPKAPESGRGQLHLPKR